MTHAKDVTIEMTPFALFTHCDMTPAEMIKVYKSRDLVEKGFQCLPNNALPCT